MAKRTRKVSHANVLNDGHNPRPWRSLTTNDDEETVENPLLHAERSPETHPRGAANTLSTPTLQDGRGGSHGAPLEPGETQREVWQGATATDAIGAGMPPGVQIAPKGERRPQIALESIADVVEEASGE